MFLRSKYRGLLILGAIFFVLLTCMPQAGAKRKKVVEPQKIIFIPHDNRPISDKQTAEVVKKLGYNVVVPPDDMLGSRDNLGNPDALWQWLRENAPGAEAAVVSSDSMLYGSLVGSRKHEYTKEQISQRTAEFDNFHKEFPKLKMYAFGSIMRTPRNGEASGHEEPEYYRSYGADIFRYTVLKDKQEVKGLTRREQKEYNFLTKLIPANALQDWQERRAKNYDASVQLIDMVRKGDFKYFVLGRDDNAPFSATHMESRHLAEVGKDLGKTQFQAMAGIDEMGMLMLTRAVNDMRREMPFIFVRYNWGRGESTIPSYSDESIGQSIADAVVAAGGMMVPNPAKADLVLCVNTNSNGKTYEANMPENDGTPRKSDTSYFMDIVNGYIAAGYPVGIADIAFANGSDNALMEQLKSQGLLYKLRAYAGWNTATSSTGFVIGEGMLVRHMTDAAVDDLLTTRYLDDWAYQANVRNTIARQLTWLRGDGVYGNLGTKYKSVAYRTSTMMKRFVEDNLPPMSNLEDIEVSFPWNRMFESDVQHGEHQEEDFSKLFHIPPEPGTETSNKHK